MTPGIPSTITGKIQYFQQRIAAWAADPGAIGLDAQQILELQGRLAAADAAYNTAQQSRQQAKDDTATQTQAVRELASYGSDLIAIIRAFADVQPDPVAVFDEADIDRPAPKGTPLPPPEAATVVAATLQQSGAVLVSWKGTTANGTYYDVYRQLDGQGAFGLVGSSSGRSFEDTTVPVGSAMAMYYTVARRDAFSSVQSQMAVIRFGMQGGQQGAQLGLAA